MSDCVNVYVCVSEPYDYKSIRVYAIADIKDIGKTRLVVTQKSYILNTLHFTDLCQKSSYTNTCFLSLLH